MIKMRRKNNDRQSNNDRQENPRKLCLLTLIDRRINVDAAKTPRNDWMGTGQTFDPRQTLSVISDIIDDVNCIEIGMTCNRMLYSGAS